MHSCLSQLFLLGWSLEYRVETEISVLWAEKEEKAFSRGAVFGAGWVAMCAKLQRRLLSSRVQHSLGDPRTLSLGSPRETPSP